MAADRSTMFLVLALLATVSFAQGAEAATVGGWSRTCIAPNWMTGVPEPVTDMNVIDPFAPFWGFTSREPGGRWLIRYNLAKIASPLTTEAVLKFLYFHECAHAQGSFDERGADCNGLAAMRRDMTVTPQMLVEITRAYNSVGRPFPTGGPC